MSATAWDVKRWYFSGEKQSREVQTIVMLPWPEAERSRVTESVRWALESRILLPRLGSSYSRLNTVYKAETSKD